MPLYAIPIVALFLWGGIALWSMTIERRKDAVWKREHYPAILGVYCALFTVVFLALTLSPLAVPFALLVSAIGYVSWKSTIFCDACDRSVVSFPFAPKRRCSHCGSEFHRHSHAAQH